MDKVLIEKELADILKVQCMNGNWNYDPYMHGMANGLILAQSIVTGEKPQFLNAPEQWFSEQTSDNKTIDTLEVKMDCKTCRHYQIKT